MTRPMLVSATVRTDDARFSSTVGVSTHLPRAVSFLDTQSGVALLSRYRRRPPAPPRGNSFISFIYLFTHVDKMYRDVWRRLCIRVCACACGRGGKVSMCDARAAVEAGAGSSL